MNKTQKLLLTMHAIAKKTNSVCRIGVDGVLFTAYPQDSLHDVYLKNSTTDINEGHIDALQEIANAIRIKYGMVMVVKAQELSKVLISLAKTLPSRPWAIRAKRQAKSSRQWLP